MQASSTLTSASTTYDAFAYCLSPEETTYVDSLSTEWNRIRASRDSQDTREQLEKFLDDTVKTVENVFVLKSFFIKSNIPPDGRLRQREAFQKLWSDKTAAHEDYKADLLGRFFLVKFGKIWEENANFSNTEGNKQLIIRLLQSNLSTQCVKEFYFKHEIKAGGMFRRDTRVAAAESFNVDNQSEKTPCFLLMEMEPNEILEEMNPTALQNLGIPPEPLYESFKVELHAFSDAYSTEQKEALQILMGNVPSSQQVVNEAAEDKKLAK